MLNRLSSRWAESSLVRNFLIIGWVILVIIPLRCALTFSCNTDAGGFWELVIAGVGLPIVVIQLYQLRSTIQKQQWRPEIHVGLFQDSFNFADVNTREVLPNKAILNLNARRKVSYALVIQNRGKLVSRFVKIHLELCQMGEGVFPPQINFRKETGHNYFVASNREDYVFRGDSNWHIYPLDFEHFVIEMVPHSNDTAAHRQYQFRCTVWAEGLSPPTTQELQVIVVD